MGGRRFCIAFSFVGEKRNIVAQVTALCAARFSPKENLYHKFHKAAFAAHDLGIGVLNFKSKQAAFVVLILYPVYDPKHLTGWKWICTCGLLNKADGHRMMTCRLDHATAASLSPTAGFMPLHNNTTEQTAAIILKRLPLHAGRPRDYCQSPVPAQPATSSFTTRKNLIRLQSLFWQQVKLKPIHKAIAVASRTCPTLCVQTGGMGQILLVVRAAYQASVMRFNCLLLVHAEAEAADERNQLSRHCSAIVGTSRLTSDERFEFPEFQKPLTVIGITLPDARHRFAALFRRNLDMPPCSAAHGLDTLIVRQRGAVVTSNARWLINTLGQVGKSSTAISSDCSHSSKAVVVTNSSLQLNGRNTCASMRRLDRLSMSPNVAPCRAFRTTQHI